MFESHLRYILGYVVSAGIIGLYSRWGLLIAAHRPAPKCAQCQSRLYPFRAGVSELASRLFLIAAYRPGAAAGCRDRAPSSLGRFMQSALSLCLLAACSNGYFRLASIPGYIERVSPAAAGELSAIQRMDPADAEVIASQV